MIHRDLERFSALLATKRTWLPSNKWLPNVKLQLETRILFGFYPTIQNHFLHQQIIFMSFWQQHNAVAKTSFETIACLSHGTFKHWHFWHECFIKYRNIYTCKRIHIYMCIRIHIYIGPWKPEVASGQASLLDAPGLTTKFPQVLLPRTY